jgi:peptidoglycan lytic transglycosylase
MFLPQLWVALAAALPTAAPVAHGPDRPSGSPAGDSIMAGAAEALSRGRPWEASRLMASVLADSARRTPEAVFLAATAASRWGGWREVATLLDPAPWLDSLYQGRGRLLLARAELERGADSAALRHALAFPGSAPDSLEGERLVVLAMALDRLNARDSAANTYRHAGERLPLVSDWLWIRAASVTDDSAGRARLYALVVDPLARARIRWSEAAAHQRTGDLEGAARGYTALGVRLDALRLRFAFSPDSAWRARVRADLLALLAEPHGPGETRGAIALVDSAFSPLSLAEELVLARAAAAAGRVDRAVSGYERVLGAGEGGAEARFGYATALARLNRYGDAAFQFNLVRAPRSLAASAAYQRGRALVRDGQLLEGRTALVDILTRYARDTVATPSALFLLGDLAADDQADSLARRYYQRLTLRFPSHSLAPAALFRAAMIAFVGGMPVTAAREFDQVATQYPRSDEAGAGAYWAGRALADISDSAGARARWELLAAGDPSSYYTGLAARRLGRSGWALPGAADDFVPLPIADSAVARAGLLARLGLGAEAGWEYDRLARTTDSSAERLLALAHAFRSNGQATRAILLARRALARGAPADARTYRLIYPVVLENALLSEASQHGVDPSLLAALIRQESMFNPAATSAAGARGLMQVMPELGGRLARSLDYPVWDPVLLYQPDVSLQLGTFHLQELSQRYHQPAHVLAAYNAGASRVERWSMRGGVDDPEVFTERIPYTETRGYVRAIRRNQEIYRALYAWPGPTLSLAPGQPRS